jgi:RimJ/RimL family protein N-acetyltransferase
MSDKSEHDAHRPPLQGSTATAGLRLEWSEAAWDTAIYGDPVLQITRLEVTGPVETTDLAPFERVRDGACSGLVSCRLAHHQLRESMLLEAAGFRFIEMLYLPELELSQGTGASTEVGIEVRRATKADLPRILQIAGTAFGNERFHVDPRLPIELADRRYLNWAASSFEHPSQRLFVVCDASSAVAFFVTEDMADGTCYWHLNAVAPELQGRGYGRKAWKAMIDHAAANGCRRVRSSIVARNHRVLNLYARLGFRFPAPLMTFHWVRAA